MKQHYIATVLLSVMMALQMTGNAHAQRVDAQTETPAVTYVTMPTHGEADDQKKEISEVSEKAFITSSLGQASDVDNDGYVDVGPTNGVAEPTPASVSTNTPQESQYASVMDALSAGDLTTWFWLLLAIFVLFVAVGYIYTRNTRPEEYSRF